VFLSQIVTTRFGLLRAGLFNSVVK
jgi:hypothetical protein